MLPGAPPSPGPLGCRTTGGGFPTPCRLHEASLMPVPAPFGQGRPRGREQMEARRAGLAIAVVVGLLTGPALAVGATRVFQRPGSSGAGESVSTSITAVTSTASVIDPAVAVAGSGGPSDMELACGSEGQSLIAREANGTITGIEQAALDSLRPICKEAGMPLVGLTATEVPGLGPDSTTSTSVASSVATVPAPPPVGAGGGRQESDDEYEGGDD
jgi:hypothetical protein